MGLLNTLRKIDAENEKALEAKFAARKQELREELLNAKQDGFFNREKFLQDVETFIAELDRDVVLEHGVKVSMVKTKRDFAPAAKVKEVNGVDYLLTLEKQQNNSYILKLWLKDVRQRIKGYFAQFVGIRINDNAAEELYEELDADGNLSIEVLSVKDFINLLEQVGEEKALYLDLGPETDEYVCHGVISHGMLKMCCSTRGNTRTLTFCFKAKG